jgi:hypothetical protein
LVCSVAEGWRTKTGGLQWKQGNDHKRPTWY